MENQDKEVPIFFALALNINDVNPRFTIFSFSEHRGTQNRYYIVKNITPIQSLDIEPMYSVAISYRVRALPHNNRKRIQIATILDGKQSPLEFWHLPWEVYEPVFCKWTPVLDLNRREELLPETTHYLKGYQILSKSGTVAAAVASHPRLSIETKNSIPTFVIESLLEKMTECPISMKLFKECSSLLITSCFHIFDEESLEAWFNTKITCPLCKQKVTSVQRFNSRQLSSPEKTITV